MLKLEGANAAFFDEFSFSPSSDLNEVKIE